MRRVATIVVLLGLALAAPFVAPAHAAFTPMAGWTTLPTREALPPSPLVRRIQELLQGLGRYSGEMHGRLDEYTVNAIRTYQQRAGLDDDGRPTEELANHIEFTSRAIELGARLDTILAEQMRAAEEALLAQPETRALVNQRPVGLLLGAQHVARLPPHGL